MLVIEQVTKSFGFHNVLNGISLALNAGERVGLVGANGVGKSTLLKMIAGLVEADSGTIHLTPGTRVGYLAQVINGYDERTVDDLISESMRRLHELEARLRQLEAAMANGAAEAALTEYGDTLERFERYGGYEMEHRVETVLNGLGIAHIPRERLFGTLSGGEKARLGLALLLLDAADALLLDEPTNHLDYHSLTWLENYLAAYRGAALIVSHDRQFLNRTVTAIVEIDEHSRTAKRYAGNYDAYHAAKVKEREKWEADYAAQQEEIRALRLEMKVTAHRSTYKAHSDNDQFVLGTKRETHAATVSKKVKAAAEKLKRIEADPIPQPPAPLRFEPRLNPAALQGRLPIVVSNLTKVYDGRAVLNGVSFTVGARARIALVGPNGAGKSTLLKLILGLEKPDGGSIQINPGVRIGYLSQDSGGFDPAETAFEAYKAGLDDLSDQQLKTILLRSGLLRYDDLGKRVRELSSGQGRKLQIGRLIAEKANLLALDEPTNDVSFDVLEALEAAIQDFPGAVIAASHDRRFLQNFGGDVWEIRDGAIIQHSSLEGYFTTALEAV